MIKKEIQLETLTHLDHKGQAQMVDVSGKDVTCRKAVANATIKMNPNTYNTIYEKKNKKGDVFAAARIAGIMAAKQTSNLIPLCHNINLNKVTIDFEPNNNDFSIQIIGTAKTNATTGVEMEALTAVSIAALTLYDMVKAIDRSIVISDIQLLQKSGGKSGDFIRA